MRDLEAMEERYIRPAMRSLADQMDRQAGISLRFVRQYDIETWRMPVRLDVLYGMATISPSFAVRIDS